MERTDLVKWYLILLGTLLSAQSSFGVGNPILLVGTNTNQFSLYYSEILKTEGLNAFDTADISVVSAATLSTYDVVILGQVPLSAAQVTTFTNWVNGGGNLIAMRPDKQLATLLGIGDTGTTLSNGYLLVNTSGAPGAGIVGQTIQFHGAADLYLLSGALSVATLYSNASAPTSSPAVTLRTGIGTGGKAAAFTYDLAQSIIYTRQGNPAWAGQARVGQGGPIRSSDMFFGNATFDPQPDWIDLNNIAIPQADEQQRLLANIILFMNQSKKPLPRFWYFPFGKKAAVIMTGDDHAQGGTAGRFDDFIASSPSGCSVANWECIRGTSYVYISSPLTNTQAVNYTAQGFEVGLHVNTNCANFTAASLESFFASQLSTFASQYPGIPAPSTNRTHCIAWSDWASEPQVELNHGIRLDTTYYYWPPSWVVPTPGFFTGSGIPMRFAQTNGTIINVYQAVSQMTDESGQAYPATINGLLDNAVGPAGYYGAFTANMHTDSNGGASQQGADQIVSAAKSRGVPVVSSKQMLQWLDGRNGSSFGSISWSGNTLTFSITPAAGANGLQAMLPATSAAGGLSSLTQSGSPVSYSVQTIKGIAYAFFSATTGTYQATYAAALPPVITAVTATPGSTTATVTWNTDKNSTSRVDYGTSPTALTLNASDPALVTNHSISLTGLVVGTIYYYRVTSVDSLGNSATLPSTSGSPATFTTTDPTPPVITAVTATPGVNGTAMVSWTTNKLANSRIDYGTSAASLTLNVTNPSTVTAHSLTLTGLTAGTTYYYRVTSVDTSGNSVTAPASPNPPASFVASSTVSVWSPSVTPAIVDAGDASAVELGMKFRSDVAGMVTGVRFYKAAANTGTHIGNLWTGTGTLLGSVSFTTETSNETASGWQQANFTTPISIAANTTYIVSYFSPLGHYSANGGFFTSAGVDNPPLHALAISVDGPNGIYRYGSTSGFPTSSFNASNYWVDLAFTNNAPPVISGVTAATTATTATITWTTNNQTNSRVDYGTSPAALTQNATNAALVTAHSIALPGLTTGTTYYYRVTSVDVFGNSATSPVPPAAPLTFSLVADTTPPVITAVTAAPGTTTATITWATNEGSTTRVDYGTSATALNLNTSNPALVTSHSITLTGLTQGVTYFYRVTSVDGSNNSASSPAPPGTGSFTESIQGNPPSEWDITGSGDATIQGFTTDISGNLGDTIHFKIKTTAAAYHLDIYRMGYYTGNGALKVATVTPSVTLPQTQPACLTDNATGLLDCGNWAESATWTIPLNAKSGIYFAKVIRNDTLGASHIVFVVRDDSSHSAILFQTSDTTWQAYNQYGGNSLYVGSPGVSPGRAYKVSYNRPITTRGTTPEDFVFNAEYPMVRWLEANGYDVSYTAGIDTDRRGVLIKNHKTFMSLGHDEYWSGTQRANVEAARDAGVHLAFLSGNEVFWKTRWENSISTPATSYRTLVCYKETHAGAVIDPQDPPTWTGTWRDPRFSPPADGGRPENAFTGTIFIVNGGTPSLGVSVPEADGKMRFWRNTTIATQAAGATATLTAGMLGYEWDQDPDNGFRPAGLIRLSTTLGTGANILLDYGSSYGTGSATHNATLHRRSSGALVFGAGTVQWSWGLDSNHDRSIGSSADVRLQQATVNLLADMGVQPTTLQSGLVFATQSTDTTPPTSTITSPVAGTTVASNSNVTIAGTASDAGGVVGGIEVSVDGGLTWHPATGRSNWTYSWDTGSGRAVQLMSRAVDDSGNIQTTPASIAVTVGGNSVTIWQPSVVPGTVDSADSAALEAGMKFRSDLAGTVTGVRFYKAATNTGSHIGNLWSITGTLLGSVNFANETASGWQQANFSTPVSIAANTTYVVSYFAPAGHYSVNAGFFTSTGVDNAPLHALATGVDGPNGVYRYGATSGFPTSSFSASNYWVDLVFADNVPPVISAVAAATTSTTATITWTTNENSNSRVDYGTSATALTLNASNASMVTAHSITLTGLTAGTNYYYRVTSADASTNTATSPIAANAPATFIPSNTTPPVITAVTATPGSTTATITWTTDKNSTSRIDYGTSATTLTSNASDGTLVTSHSLNLTGLATGTTYYYRVTSVDGSGNSATSPIAANAPATFTTIDPTPPAITVVAAAPGAVGTATITWTTNKLSNSRVDYGTSSASLNLNVSDATMVTSHSLALTGLTTGTTYYYRVTSADALGNSASSPVSPATASFVENAPVSVWSPSVIPATVDSGDGSALEVGMKFRSDVAGVVTAVRFYKAAANTGTHIGNLWSSTGTLLGTVTFANETASGWQQANFGTPVSIAANTTYIVSYFTPTGHYSVNSNFFTSTGVDSPPLHALATGVDGPNEVYRYGAASGFPTSTYNSGNYWVDLVFADNASPVISAVAAATTSTTATITWITNENSNSRVDYGTSATALTLNSSNAAMVTAHSVTLTGLTAGATYYYRVTSADALSNSATSPIAANAPATFIPADTTPPVITAVTATPGSNTAAITWATDKNSTSRIDYGTSPTVLTSNASDGTLVTSHSLSLTGLATGTTYYYRVTSVDGSGNSATSPPTSGSPASFATIDSTPPVITAVAAAPGLSGTATITWTTNKLSNSRVDYGTAAGSLTLNVTNTSLVTTHSLTLTALTTGTTYYYRVTSADGLGNSASSPVSPATATFVENPPVSVWSPSTIPGTVDSLDGAALEIGMKFRSDVAGMVAGVRFYKATTNTGTHIGNLWSSTGTLLGSVTFSNETASGWQQANFTTPVSIAANTTYIVSYFAPGGHYSFNGGFFTSSGVDNAPLHALATGVDGGNGVYRYGAASGFPASSFNAANYWVDLVFNH